MRNVLLTTMSTIGRYDVNYYYSKETGKYCSGIASTEAGTKCLLSDKKADINEIVVIGSSRTYSPGTDEKDKDPIGSPIGILSDYEELKQKEIKNLSAFSFYRYRIAQFIQGDGIEEAKIGAFDKDGKSGIEERRRRELEEIVGSCFEKAGLKKRSVWFSDATEDITKAVKREIREDVEKNFIEEEDYRPYLGESEEFPEFMGLEKDEERLRVIDDLLKDAREKSKNAGMLESEAYGVRMEGYFEDCREKLEDVQRRLKTEAHEAVIIRLRRAVRSLSIEVNALRSNRIQREIAYAAHYIYTLLDDTKKMKPASGAGEIKISFVPEKREETGSDNLQEIIDAIRGNENETVNLYVDVQGGGRTDGYVRNAVLSVLNNEPDSHFSLKKIVATNYERNNFANAVVDETTRYKITDLVSGMNAFLKYGRADLIKEYCDDVGIDQNTHINDLVSEMKEIDHSLSLCNITSLVGSLEKIKKIFAQTARNTDGTAAFAILEEGIKRDYQAILDDPKDYIALCRWAIKHGFIQQALTIIESKMPELFVKKGVYYYCKDEEERKKVLELFRKKYNAANKSEKYKFNDIDHYFVKDYAAREYNDRGAKGKNYGLKTKNMNQDLPVVPKTLHEDKVVPKTLHEDKDDIIKILNKYKKVSNLRNTTAHAGERNDSGEDQYEDVKKEMDIFLNMLEDIIKDDAEERKQYKCIWISSEEVKQENNKKGSSGRNSKKTKNQKKTSFNGKQTAQKQKKR